MCRYPRGQASGFNDWTQVQRLCICSGVKRVEESFTGRTFPSGGVGGVDFPGEVGDNGTRKENIHMMISKYGIRCMVGEGELLHSETSNTKKIGRLR